MANFKLLKEGSVLSENQYYSVVKIKGNQVQLKNDYGEDIVVNEDYVNSCLISADQFTETKTVNKTEAAQIFLNNPSVVMQVSFQKQVKEADVKAAMHALYPNKGGKILSEAEYKKQVNTILKEALDGVERVITGRHFGELNDLGRVNFIDMEIEKDASKGFDNRQRQTDPRTINWLCVKNVKYIVK